jgi:hypothetical protein
MWTSVIRSPTRAARCAPLMVLALLATPPLAARDSQPDRPVTDDSVSAGDVAATPVDDLNLRSKAIPALLTDAGKDPYSSAGMGSCEHIATAVGDLDAVLGEDFDTAAVRKRSLSAGWVAREAVGIFIPFRGLIREVSGASGGKRKMADAIIVGAVRRAYLKGLGEKMDCPYPARPADAMTKAVIDDISHGVNNPAPEPAPDPTAAPPADPATEAVPGPQPDPPAEPATPADPVFSEQQEPASPA